MLSSKAMGTSSAMKETHSRPDTLDTMGCVLRIDMMKMYSGSVVDLLHPAPTDPSSMSERPPSVVEQRKAQIRKLQMIDGTDLHASTSLFSLLFYLTMGKF
jgi:hypothetical protein